MERIEYRDVVDKADWPRGAWDSEPDKIQWQDEATGLPCLIVRSSMGFLCGYVGVSPGHSFHGLEYGQCPRKPPCEESYCGHGASSVVDAHGGLTFARSCTDTSKDVWEAWRKRQSLRAGEAQQYPQGCVARSLKEWAGCHDDYEAWKARAEARYICHKADNDCVWWFGFDCGHCDDLAPGTIRYGRGPGDDVYRDIAYVTEECRKLAEQLSAIKGEDQ